MEHNVGNKIKYIGNSPSLSGKSGIIRVIEGKEYGVEFEDYNEGHNLNGRCPSRNGIWLYEESVKLVSSKPEKEKKFFVAYDVVGCGDPIEWFYTLAKTKKRARELGENSAKYINVKFGEIKSLYKVLPSVKTTQIKI